MISFDYKLDPPEEEPIESIFDYVTCNGCGVGTHVSKVTIQMCKDNHAPHWLLCNDCLQMKLGIR